MCKKYMERTMSRKSGDNNRLVRVFHIQSRMKWNTVSRIINIHHEIMMMNYPQKKSSTFPLVRGDDELSY